VKFRSKDKRISPFTLSVSVHPEREAVEGSSRRVEVLPPVRAEREERTVEVQADISVHPERIRSS